MGTTADKLQYLIDAKSAISAAIELKGGTVPQELSGYADAIAALPSGSSDLAPKIIDRSITELNASDFGSLTRIGGYAFRSCNYLSSVTFSSAITTVQTDAFYGCTSLLSVEIPNNVTSLGNSMFRGCTNLSSISLGTGFSTIPNYFLYGCTSLLSVEIPNNVTSIASYAFQDCSSLTSVTIGNGLSSIGNSAFYNCSELTSITIPDSVTRIASNVFYGCSSLMSVTIPNGVTSIEGGAFSRCSNCLIYDFSNHTSVPTLGGTNAFYGTNANKKIIVPDALYNSWKATNNWNSSTNGIVNAITRASEA